MKLSNIILALILAIILFYAFFTGMKKSEQVECNKWKQEEENYQNYYVTSWQVEQCEQYGITFNSPVEDRN